MSAEIADIIIPSIAFFVAFFLGFTLIELLLIALIRWLIFRDPHFVINVAIRSKVQHGKTIQRTALIFIVLFILVLMKFTAFIDLLAHAEMGVKILAFEMLLLLTFVYLRITRHLPPLEIGKQIYKYLYLYTSSILFILTIVLANQHYESYKDFINANLTYPIKEGVEARIESRKRKELLSVFRLQVYGNACPRVDFTQDSGAKPGLLNFVYVTTHKDFSLNEAPIIPTNYQNYLSGRLCSHEGISFLLTDHGQWYWVVEG